MLQSFQGRVRLLSVLIILFALVLVAKLYFVQIIDAPIYKAKADHQYVEGANFFDRGSIFFSTKDNTRVPAAGIQSGFILAINPALLTEHSVDMNALYDKLGSIADIDKSLFMEKAAKIVDPYE